MQAPSRLSLFPTVFQVSILASKASGASSLHRRMGEFADIVDAASVQQVEDLISSEHLQKLARMFQKPNRDKTRGLDIEEFREAVKEIMGNIENEDIDVMFMKVDSNCDGSVVWEEYLNYMLLQYRGKVDMLEGKSHLLFQTPMKVIPAMVGQEIIKVQFYPSQGWARDKQKAAKSSSSRSLSGRFLMVTRDGVLLYWSDAFKLLRTIHLDQTKRKHTHKMWVIDMVCLPNISLLAIASTERTIEFFDISGIKCDRVFYLAELEGCATALDYWTDGHKGVFCAGDAKGNVLIFTSLNVLANGLFNVRPYIIKPGVAARIPMQLLLKEKGSLYSSFRMPALHEDWCHQIKFIPELNLVASCSATDKGAMVLTALPLNNQGKPHSLAISKRDHLKLFHESASFLFSLLCRSSAIALKKGILCFDYSPRMNVLVTGGLDPLIRIWNPYVTNSPITVMKGHVTAVTHVIVSGYRNTILSISKDKNIRIWDLLDHFCLQSIPSRSISLGNCPIIGVYYNELNNVLICTTTSIGILYAAAELMEGSGSEITSHDQPLCAALYNKNFQQVVSSCYGGVVRVWDIMTGQKMMQFKASEGKQTEVTAMAFDGAERRLITGLKDGTIKFWNFNNGDCLLELPRLDKTEISGILYINQKIYVSGWSKRVAWYLDGKAGEVFEHKHWKCYHSEDIFSMDMHNNKLLVTASCDGDVVIWNIDSGRAFCRFNASQSPLTLMPNRVFMEDDNPRKGSAPKNMSLLLKFSTRAEARKKCWVDASPRLPTRPISAKNISSSLSGYWKAPASAPPGMRQHRGKEREEAKRQQVALSAGAGEGAEVGRKPSRESRAAGAGKQRKNKLNCWTELKGSSAAVQKVLFLQTRERSPDTAILLTSSADGYVYAWSVGGKGGLLGKFRPALRDESAVVNAMATDSNDWILLTGDSLGYIKIWDIEHYCKPKVVKRVSEVGKTEASPKAKNEFRVLIPRYCRGPATHSPPLMQTTEVLDGWITSLVAPDLLSSWRGHLKNISHIVYVERLRLIVTASDDCNIKLWLLSGRHIGTFGQSVWDVRLQHLNAAKVPVDIRRVGSVQTLKVLNEGASPLWKRTQSLMQSTGHLKKQQSALMQYLHEKAGLSLGVQKMGGETSLKEKRIIDQVEATWQKWEKTEKLKSEILGCSYKQKARRHLPEFLPSVKTYIRRDQARVYHCMQYADLQNVTPPPVPELLVEMQQLQASFCNRPRSARKQSTPNARRQSVKAPLQHYLSSCKKE
ncbi:EF-hand calcium-binding domain-containing protein 8 [Alligator mississippiensis]|uniref:EF-hand calcium-binding domain-containing protein 8 n=1 Tax=Alligator mississippiensis TaxID=8496 RepID=UPI0028772665|nr:EF-hand calcium-binding domain-containing protein 8 [Alligator mississippiensis]